MSEQQRLFSSISRPAADISDEPKPKGSRLITNIILFLLTFVSTTIAGTFLAGYIPWEIENWQHGILYSVLIMTFLLVHEFGHYIAARKHGVKASLPYFLPMPIVFLSPFGTFGAFIRTKTPILSRRALFDIGAAGPLAGFIVCLIILIIGMATLPPIDYLYNIHPEYKFNSMIGGGIRIIFGDTILFPLLHYIFAPANGYLPPMVEIQHYPFLCVGWFGMFVTALNMLPFGQLDGGHILYAMFGKYQKRIASVAWWLIVVLGMGSVFADLSDILRNNSPDAFYTFLQSVFTPAFEAIHRIAPWYFEGWNGWLFWALIGRFLIKLKHPPVEDEAPIGTMRMMLGWIAILAFVVSFSYNGIVMTGIFSDQPAHPGKPGTHVVQSVLRP